MTVTLLEKIRNNGVTLNLADGDTINYHGAAVVVSKWLPELRAHKAEIVEALKNESRFTDWRIHYDQAEKQVLIPDGATLAEVKALYSAALNVEAIQRPPCRPATAAERAELWRLVNAILTDAPSEIGEAFAAGLADIEAALICYRALTA